MNRRLAFRKIKLRSGNASALTQAKEHYRRATEYACKLGQAAIVNHHEDDQEPRYISAAQFLAGLRFKRSDAH